MPVALSSEEVPSASALKKSSEEERPSTGSASGATMSILSWIAIGAVFSMAEYSLALLPGTTSDGRWELSTHS